VPNPHFPGRNYRLLLISVIVIFATSLAAYVTLGLLIAHPSDPQAHVLGVLDFVVTSSLGAILGLLAPKE
jgi:hypothetical protein